MVLVDRAAYPAKTAIGVDFGSESARALLLDITSAEVLATAEHEYADGIVRGHLPSPDTDIPIGAGWALQNPQDYLTALHHTVPAVMQSAGVSPDRVIGVGLAFTSCTMLPTTSDGTPLCSLAEFRREPHAWVKLWAHHAAQDQADRITAVAEEMCSSLLARYGGRVSSESFFAKSLQILQEAPDVYAYAGRLIEASDWLAWQLTGSEVRGAATAGYKALRDEEEGFPPREFFAAIDPGFAGVLQDKMSRTVIPLGRSAGALSEQAANLTGLVPGTPVAVPCVDAHASVPGAGVTAPGSLVMVMGTSICHMTVDMDMRPFEGAFGIVRDGILPGYWGYEAGQPAFGDMFNWFAEGFTPEGGLGSSESTMSEVHGKLADEAGKVAPGRSGLLALDWWSGNRSVLLDGDLSGLIVGLTTATTPAEVYRALIESAAFGTRIVIDRLLKAGVSIDTIVASGGLPKRNPLIVEIFADVTGLPIGVAASEQASALGAAMYGAVAAGPQLGGFASIVDATERLAPAPDTQYEPDPSATAVYDRLYAEYVDLHDHFGRREDVMKRLKSLRNGAE